jgi:flagellar assembly factor FliW
MSTTNTDTESSAQRGASIEVASAEADGTLAFSTTRFGSVEVEQDRVIHFAGGLPGFVEAKRFVLLESTAGEDSSADTGASDEPSFFWLQSVDEPQLAFVVCDPTTFVPGYGLSQVPLREEFRQELGFGDASDAEQNGQLLVICNRVGEWLTGNLLGPLVINAETFVGKQVVLTERRWGTRHPLMRLASEPAGQIRPQEQTQLRRTA